MHFSPGFFGSILTSSGKWGINLDQEGLVIQRRDIGASIIDYESVKLVSVTQGVIWATVTIQHSEGLLALRGISNRHANLLKTTLIEQVSNSLLQILKGYEHSILSLDSVLEEFLNLPYYLAHRDISKWLVRQESNHSESAKAALSILHHSYTPKLSPEMQMIVSKLLDVFSGNSILIKRRNDKFVASEMVAHEGFFDSVEKTPLTTEQRIASIVMEDRNLLVAAAGSGKTSTVVGKIGYALSKKLIKPHEILVLAFNNHAARELEERIGERLRPLLA